MVDYTTDEKPQTEYNSNALTVFRLHKHLERFNLAMSYNDNEVALTQLYCYYAEIVSKLTEFKKTQYLLDIDNAFKKAKNGLINYSNSNNITLRLQFKGLLFDLCNKLQMGANVVGLGLTSKDDSDDADDV